MSSLLQTTLNHCRKCKCHETSRTAIIAHLEFAENNLKKESAGAIRSGKGELWWVEAFQWEGWLVRWFNGRVGWLMQNIKRPSSSEQGGLKWE